MKENRVDRRVKYTRRALKDALIELMSRKLISQITIKEICQTADINRSTFYAHYSSQQALLESIEDELINDINSQIDSNIGDSTSISSPAALDRIFEYIHENGQVCAILLGENGDVRFQKRIFSVMQEKFVEEWKDKLGQFTSTYVSAFFVSGAIGIIQSWLESGMKESAHEVSRLLMKLTKGAQRVILFRQND